MFRVPTVGDKATNYLRRKAMSVIFIIVALVIMGIAMAAIFFSGLISAIFFGG